MSNPEKAISLRQTKILYDDLRERVETLNEEKYEKPATGIPASDLASDVTSSISSKLNASEKGSANGVAELDQNGKVPASQLPSFVDDVIEYNSLNNFPATGESGKIYVALDTNLAYRWSGSAYVEISPSLALGETSSTAYRGDRGKAAYDAAVANVDSAPTANSTNLVQSGGVYSELATKYIKPGTGIPASDLADGVIPDVSGKADKTDTVLNTTLSRGRKANTTVGTGSFAFGNNVEASGNYSYAEGQSTASGNYSHAEGQSTASGDYSHSEGVSNHATGRMSHAEGNNTYATGNHSHAEGQSSHANGLRSHAEGGSTANGNASHAEGSGTEANGPCSHAEGIRTTADGFATHVFGGYNIVNNFDCYDEWEPGKEYLLNEVVKITDLQNDTVVAYSCTVPNNDSVFDPTHWLSWTKMKYIEIVGNGNEETIDYSTYETVKTFSNARALDWQGNEYLNGDIYINCNPDSTGGTKVATISDIPDISGKVDKSAIENSGITAKSYTTIKDITVTTATSGTHTIPYAESSGGSLTPRKKYKVTFNGTIYEFNAYDFFKFVSAGNTKGYTYIGKLNLYEDNVAGVCNEIDNVPFCLVYNSAELSGIQIYTQTAGTYTIKIERIDYTKEHQGLQHIMELRWA